MHFQSSCFGAFFVVFFSKGVLSKTSCSIELNLLYTAEEEPLFLNASVEKIIYPKNKANIEVPGGEKLRVYCGENNFKKLKVNGDSLLVQCNSGSYFKILNQEGNAQSADDRSSGSLNGLPSLEEENPGEIFSGGHPWFPLQLRRRPDRPNTLTITSDSVQPTAFACRSVVRSAVKPGGPCGVTGGDVDHQEFSIGFPVAKTFLPLISVCFNTKEKSVLWSGHVVTPSVEYHMNKVPRIQFIQDSIPYGGNQLNVEHLYSRYQQTRTIAALLQSEALAAKYIEPRGNGFFARGHLAPKGDFVYAGEQLATFHFINVAPQWQYFNGGQWEEVESTLRKTIIKAKEQATILTLTLGIAQLQDERGNDRDIYLFYNQENGDKLIKVPKLYAKIINFGNSTANDKNVVIVGVNQPYENHVKLTANDVICENVCHKYPWLSEIARHNTHYSAGFIYCCSPRDFIAYLKSGQGYMADYNGHRSYDFHGPRTSSQSTPRSYGMNLGSESNVVTNAGSNKENIDAINPITLIYQLSDLLPSSF